MVGFLGNLFVFYSGLTLRNRSGDGGRLTLLSPSTVSSLTLLVYSFIPCPSICPPTPLFPTLPWMHSSQLPEWPAPLLPGTAALNTIFRPNHVALCLSTSFPLAAAHVTTWASRAYLTCHSAVTMARLPSIPVPHCSCPSAPCRPSGADVAGSGYDHGSRMLNQDLYLLSPITCQQLRCLQKASSRPQAPQGR